MLHALAMKMIEYDGPCVKRIQHFMKVHGFAALIAEGEGVDEATRFTLEAAALVHDIGIKASQEKYGSSAGPLQEKEGAPLAKQMLRSLGFPQDVTARVAYLVGHHHTYSCIDGIDYQILVEADFLVNLFEHGDAMNAVRAVREKIFRTATGKKILDEMFGC